MRVALFFLSAITVGAAIGISIGLLICYLWGI